MSMLRCADAEVATAFYAHTFGWSSEAFGPPEAGMWLWRLPGYVGGEPQQPVPRDVVGVMASAADARNEPSHRTVDFWVHDADATPGSVFHPRGVQRAPSSSSDGGRSGS